MKMVVKVAQCNIRSLNTSSKLIEDLCKLRQIGVLSLTEIWHPEVTNLKFLHKWTWNVSIRNNKEGGGAATLVSPQIKTHPRKELNNPWLESVWCDIYFENKKILLGSVYIPPDNEQDMGLLIETLGRISDENENVIVMGDFNAKHPMWYNEKNNKLGDQLSSYLTTSDYTLVNNNMHTFKTSVIDLTLVKGCRNLVSNWSAHPEIMVNTDHNMILFDLSLKVTQTKRPRWNVKKADWDVWKNETKRTFETVMNNIALRGQQDINTDYAEVRDSMIELGKNHIGKTKGWTNSKPWRNEEKSIEVHLNKLRRDVTMKRLKNSTRQDMNSWKAITEPNKNTWKKLSSR